MFVRVIVLVAAVSRTLLPQLLTPFVAMAMVVGAIAAFQYYRGGGIDGTAVKGDLSFRNPFSLTAAAKFAAFFAVVLVAVKIAEQHFAPSSLYALAGISGLADVDAITLSMAEFAKSGEARIAVIAIVIAALANTIVKCGIAVALAGLTFARPLLIATVATVLVGLGTVYLM